MLNRLADRILNRILPHESADAVCTDTYRESCTLCAGGRIYFKKCQNCNGFKSCTPCQYWTAC